MWVAFSDRVRAAASKQRSIGASALAGVALAAVILAPSGAAAQCTDTFPYTITVSPGTPFLGFPKQNDFPLGTGSSLNALMSTINTVNTAFLTSSSSFVGAPAGSAPNQSGGGVWSRAIGGNVETKSATTSTIDASKGVGSFPGQGICNGTVREEYAGVQFGFDIMTRNIGGTGGNIHLGVTAGYIGAQNEDRTAELHYTRPAPRGGTADFLSPAGSFKSTTDVPFLGFFATYTNGNFFMDGVVRFDYYDMKLTDPNSGLSGESLKAWGGAVAGNVGYRVPLPANWFIEPSGGISLSKTWVDSINVPGKATTSFGPPIALNGGTVEVDDVLSILGRASLRAGVNISGEFVTWQPFATASIFREFAGEAKAHSQVIGPASISYFDSMHNPQTFIPPNNNLILNTSTERIGTFAQFGLGTSLVFGNTGWLSYARVDYKTGDKTEGVGGSVGVRFHW
jgi:hypothetical protein